MPNENLLIEPITSIAAIKELLPHREPMLMVDGLLYFDGKKAIAELTILESNILIENKTFAETGLIEHMAQTAALMIGYKYVNQNLPIKEGFIAAIKNFNIENLPIINEVISTEVEITYEVANMTNVTLVSRRNNKVLASSEMTLVLKENG